MKKRFTLLSVMMIATSLSFAQNVTKPAPVSVSKMKTGKLATTLITQENIPASEITAKAPGDIVWSTNLTSTNNWVVSSLPGSAQSSINGWKLSSTGIPPIFGTTKINSASGGQYAVFWNGDITATPAPTGVVDAEYIMLLDSAFDLSAFPSVNFEFQQFGALFVEEQVVEASIDGTNWVQIGTNTDMGMYTAAGGSAYANPTNRSYNLNKAFPMGADFSSVKFRFRVFWAGNITGANRGIAYGWFVDDIKLTEGLDHDLNLMQAYTFVGNPVNELMYTKFPLGQINTDSEVNFSAEVFNEGPSSETTILNVTGAGGFSENSSPVILTAFMNDSIGLNSPYTIDPTVGNQNFTFSVTSDNTLGNTGNDTKSYAFAVTPKVMAVDGYNGTTASMTSSFIGWASGTGAAEIGTYFEIFADDAVGAIQIGIANITGTDRAEYVGRSVQGKIYDMSGSAPLLLDATLETVISNASFGKLVTAYMITPTPLTAGKAYLVTAALAAGSPVPVAMGGQIVSGNVLGFNAEALTGLAPDEVGGKLVTTPIIRLDFNDYTGVNEIAAQFDLNVYPNPFSSNTEVAFELKNDANVSINITDITGRTVSTVDSQMYTSGAHTVSVNGTNLNAGVYNCTITIGNNVITKRIVKK